MLRLFVSSLLVIVAALFVTYYLDVANDPGYLLIAWRNYTFETSLFALAVLLLTLFILTRLLLVLLGWINPWHLVRFGRRYRARRQDGIRNRTSEGLMYFARGNWQAAWSQLERSFNDREATVVNYLAAAYAAFRLGRKDLWIQCLDQAARRYPVALSTINSLRAELLLKSRHPEQSLAVLEQLRRTSINDPRLLDLMKQVCLELQDWKRLRELLPVLRKEKVIDAEEYSHLEKRLFVEDLNGAAEKVRKSDQSRDANLAELEKRWKKGAGGIRDDEGMANYYAELLLGLDAPREAARAIETFLATKWSDLLVEKYGELDCSEPDRQLVNGEKWLQQRPNSPRLLLALGRIAMRNSLWGKAREYFEASVRLAPTAEGYGELGRLVRALGDQASGEKYFTRYAELAGRRLPDLPLPPAIRKKAG